MFDLQNSSASPWHGSINLVDRLSFSKRYNYYFVYHLVLVVAYFDYFCDSSVEAKK